MRRDCRGYPVFTVFDIEQIMKWRDGLSAGRRIQGAVDTQLTVLDTALVRVTSPVSHLIHQVMKNLSG